MPRAKGWHQSAVARAKERAATLAIDQAAAQLAAQEHLTESAPALVPPAPGG